ncbi:MAG TPA: iron-containing redox enzyme family protein [Solirubrobacteraceae bacterium]|nr:iron-containing redox enzyme family protein [Solirubrobacteraceae bacterium]
MKQEVEIVPYRDGPYLVRGPVVLNDQNGERIESSRRTVALCRCGKSRMRPFCDGTHQLLRFRADSAAEQRWGGGSADGERSSNGPAAGSPTGGRLISLPAVRGPWTEALTGLLREPGWPESLPDPPADPLADDDFQMALYLCYELHYSGIVGVADELEWHPGILLFRAALERQFARAVEQAVGAADEEDGAGGRPPAFSVGEELQRLVAQDDGPPLSRFVELEATLDQVLELVVHRSAYQLKEADPHSWAIPRLSGRAKAALVEIQSDEYGGGRAERIHAALFAQTMRGLGLEDRYGAHLDLLPGITLATVNLMSWFGLHRRLRGAVTGHLAAFEMTSSVPNRRYGNGLRRLGFGAEVTDFYDEHVEADAVHENIAAWDLADGLARAEPALAGDIVFGARALLKLEARWAEHLLGSWSRNETSLRAPLPSR